MGIRTWACQLIVIFLVNLDLTCGFFDLDYPILYSDRFSNTESHFGFSVTLMKSTNLTSQKGWLLIGAPTSNSTDRTYVSHNVDEAGVIWRCSLGRSAGSETCEILNIDPIPSNNNDCSYKTCSDFPVYESKNSGWLGVSMSSIDNPSGKFVSCAHRLTRGNGSVMNGICYFLSEQDINRKLESSRDLLVDLTTYSHRLNPFFERGNKDNANQNQYFILDAADPNHPDAKGVKWALGQAGISTHLSQFSRNGIELLVGAPGLYVWSGGVLRYRDGNVEPGSITRKNSKDFRDFSNYRISTRPVSPSNWYDYFGYAVTSGIFDSSGETLYVGGAPRGGTYENRLNGQVVIFRIPLETKQDEIYILNGDQIASYFGSVLLAVDFNGDGISELFVAAPLFSRDTGPSTRQGSSRSIDSPGTETTGQKIIDIRVRTGDQGCVYMYSGEKQLREEGKPLRFFGDENQSAWARFGSAMTSLGDINGDGLNDIAIGAPFENGGLGAVYLYYGNKENKLQQVQKITPKDFMLPNSSPRYLQGFGSSFSSGQDIDNNETPDLAIGSYTSGRVVLLRSRPVIEIKGEIKFITRHNVNITVLPRGEQTFFIASRVGFINKLGKSQQQLRVNVTITFAAKHLRFEVKPRNDEGIIRPGKNPGEWEYNESISSAESYARYYIFEATLQEVYAYNETDPNLPPFIVQQRVIYNDFKPKISRKGSRLYDITGNK